MTLSWSTSQVTDRTQSFVIFVKFQKPAEIKHLWRNQVMFSDPLRGDLYSTRAVFQKRSRSQLQGSRVRTQSGEKRKECRKLVLRDVVSSKAPMLSASGNKLTGKCRRVYDTFVRWTEALRRKLWRSRKVRLRHCPVISASGLASLRACCQVAGHLCQYFDHVNVH